VPPFLTSDVALARRLEAAEAANGFAMAAGSSSEAEALLGGCALFAGPGSPMTHALGIGMDPATEEEFDRLEEFFRSRGSACLIDLCPLAHPTVVEQITRRGYKVIEFNNLMLRRAEAEPEPPGVRIARATPERRLEWGRLVMSGFSDGAEPTPGMLAMMDAMAPADYELFADLDGRPSGGAAMSIREGVALLYGDSTLPEARGRGLQQALIRHRVTLAAEAGCDWVMACVIPGSGSHRNYERAGFSLAYMRVNVMRDL
jgi:GNAT superfamily N-acetyltransferase